VVKARTAARVQRLKAKIGEGCPACKDWPHCWILGEDDPEPPMRCERCGRRFAAGMRIDVGVDPNAI
jgi:hypothetical protein